MCEKGEILEVPEGECCPICVLGVDCSAVLCLRPVCEEGETIEVPEGECCPICAKKGLSLSTTASSYDVKNYPTFPFWDKSTWFVFLRTETSWFIKFDCNV